MPTLTGCGPFEATVTKERLRDLAFAGLQNYEAWVLQTYNLLPTDTRFLDLRPWECEYAYWRHTLWRRLGKRLAEKLPATKLEHLMEEEFFEEQLAKLEADDAAEAAKVQAEAKRTMPPERLVSPTEPVSQWKARDQRP